MLHVVTDLFNIELIRPPEEIQKTRFKSVSNAPMVHNLSNQDTRPGVNNVNEVKIGLAWLGLFKPAGID